MSEADIDFMLFDVNTRKLLKGLRSATSIGTVDLQVALRDDDSLGWVFGHYQNIDLLYVDRNGDVRRLPPSGEVPLLDLPPYE